MMRGSMALRIVQRYHPKVTSVTDAKRPTAIEITAEDCAAGKMRGPSECAMARAFSRHYDGAIISLSTAYLIKGTKATRYLVPDTVSREIVSFDRAHDFRPGIYHLAAIEPARRIGIKRSQPRRTDPKKYKKAKKKRHYTAGIRSISRIPVGAP